MTKVIIYSDSNLDSYYEQVQEYLHAKYHTYPTGIMDLDISDVEYEQQCYYQSMAMRSKPRKKKRFLGKLVV